MQAAVVNSDLWRSHKKKKEEKEKSTTMQHCLNTDSRMRIIRRIYFQRVFVLKNKTAGLQKQTIPCTNEMFGLVMN